MFTPSTAGAMSSRQNSGRGRFTSPAPVIAGSTSAPSITRSVGGFTPVTASTVGNRSLPITGTSLVVPGLMRPGSRTIPGTRMPPSYMLRLRPRSPPVEPWLRPLNSAGPSGPLSAVNTTSVLSASFCSSSAFISVPKAWSSCDTLPWCCRRSGLVSAEYGSWNRGSVSIGRCGSCAHTARKNGFALSRLVASQSIASAATRRCAAASTIWPARSGASRTGCARRRRRWRRSCGTGCAASAGAPRSSTPSCGCRRGRASCACGTPRGARARRSCASSCGSPTRSSRAR